MRETPRKFFVFAVGQKPRLLDPALALDSPVELENFLDAPDLGRGPVRHLGERTDAQAVKQALVDRTDADDAAQIVGRDRWSRFPGLRRSWFRQLGDSAPGFLC